MTTENYTEHQRQAAAEFAENLMNTATSLDEIIREINSNQDIIKYLVPASMMKGYHTTSMVDTEFKNPFVFKIKYFYLSAYERQISNRHHWPHRGFQNHNGMRMFPNGELIPKHYPGFIGKIGLESSHFYESHVLNRLGIIIRHHDIDSYIASEYSNTSATMIPVYRCYVFLEDYPKLTEELFEYMFKADHTDSIEIYKEIEIEGETPWKHMAANRRQR
jgi:hypothetical protein